MDRVLNEHKRRQRDGETENSLAKEAIALHDWLREMHPYAPKITPGAIRNGIRKVWNEVKSREVAKPD